MQSSNTQVNGEHKKKYENIGKKKSMNILQWSKFSKIAEVLMTLSCQTSHAEELGQ